MEKEFRTRVEGELNIDRWGTNLRAGVENVKNYTYLNQKAVPEQNSGNIQILSATLKQNFRAGIFHLDNEVTWQKSSNETVLPLPQISVYSNLYLLTKLAKRYLPCNWVLMCDTLPNTMHRLTRLPFSSSICNRKMTR